MSTSRERQGADIESRVLPDEVIDGFVIHKRNMFPRASINSNHVCPLSLSTAHDEHTPKDAEQTLENKGRQQDTADAVAVACGEHAFAVVVVAGENWSAKGT